MRSPYARVRSFNGELAIPGESQILPGASCSAPFQRHFAANNMAGECSQNANKSRRRGILLGSRVASGIGRLGKNPNGASQNPLGTARMAVRDFEGKI